MTAARLGPAAARIGPAKPRLHWRSALLLLPLLLLGAAPATAPRYAAAEPTVAPGETVADCGALLKEFYEFNKREAVPFSGDNLVYFLHVPRTAGRTFHTCLLKQGTPARRRCPKSYDHLRIDMEIPACGLLSSHDDFSVVQQLPEGTAVVTQLRDPLERFLSAYEFAVEVASRQVRRPRTKRPNHGRTLTDEVWPWSHLVPFFLQDIRGRMAALRERVEAEKAAGSPGHWVEMTTDEGRGYYHNAIKNMSLWELTSEEDRSRLLPPLDPYANELIMPLAEFAAHPIAAELLHNGEAFQVLGLTNYSHWSGAEGLRHCAERDPTVAKDLTNFALKRLRTFSHVGTTERLGESVESAAASLGMILDAPAFAGGESRRANTDNPNRALRYAEAMAEGQRSHKSIPAWQRLQQEAAANAAGARKASGADAGLAGGLEEGSTGGPGVESHHPEDFYDDGSSEGSAASSGGSGGDADSLHALAGDVRRAQERVTAVTRDWNHAIEASAPQEELRKHREALTRARAELAAAQDLLLGVRDDETERRARELKEAAVDKRMDRTLGQEFHTCAGKAQGRNAQRRTNSLAGLVVPGDGRRVQFSKRTRAAIPQAVLDDIRRRGAMDSELYTTAQTLLQQKRDMLSTAGLLKRLPPASDAAAAAVIPDAAGAPVETFGGRRLEGFGGEAAAAGVLPGLEQAGLDLAVGGGGGGLLGVVDATTGVFRAKLPGDEL